MDSPLAAAIEPPEPELLHRNPVGAQSRRVADHPIIIVVTQQSRLQSGGHRSQAGMAIAFQPVLQVGQRPGKWDPYSMFEIQSPSNSISSHDLGALSLRTAASR